MEEGARIIRQSTPKFAKMISSKYGDLGSRKVQKDLAENHGRKVSRNYIQKTAKAVGELVLKKEKEWEYILPKKTKKTTIVSIGLDGTTSYLVGQGYRETMSGTISFIDKEGNRLHTIYIAHSPEYGKGSFKERFQREIEQVKAIFPKAHYTGVADGAADNWSFLNPIVDSTTIDFWHVTGYLALASKAYSKSRYEQKQWYEKTRHKLRHEQESALKILKEIQSFERKHLSDSKKQKLAKAITYFFNHHHQMNYAVQAAKGLPIGSGQTEAACKVIVKERLCCSGMRWKESAVQAVLNIRCLTHTPKRWNQLWNFIDSYGIAA